MTATRMGSKAPQQSSSRLHKLLNLLESEPHRRALPVCRVGSGRGVHPSLHASIVLMIWPSRAWLFVRVQLGRQTQPARQRRVRSRR